MDVPYKPIHSVEWLEKYLSTNYYKKKYDRYMWWRSYTPRENPLSNNHPLKDRILNGDFELGPYIFEIELVEHKINQKWIECKGYEDTFREAIQVDKARRKRLKEDRDKDEVKKLQELKKAFLLHLKMTSKQYDREVINYRGPDIINFYYRMREKFGEKAIRMLNAPKGLALAHERNC